MKMHFLYGMVKNLSLLTWKWLKKPL